MARIRTIKPDFFRHEELQDLELKHPGSYVMLLFAGLWTQCDKNGVFEYKPRQLKLDILPFIEYNIVASLLLLSEAKIVSLLVLDDKVYGYVPSFKTHQRINGKESQVASKFPDPSEMLEYKGHIIKDAVGNYSGNIGEATGKQQGSPEGKGREGNKEQELKVKRLADFEIFWDTFAFKQGKGGAEKSWLAIQNYSDDLFKKIIEGAKREADQRPSIISQNRTPKWAQGWITERRWEDEPELSLIVRPVSIREQVNQSAGDAFLRGEY